MEPLIGEIKLFAGNFAPRGWALCQGQTLSIAQNTALFSILGITYGGNGQTTFALPDLRGRAAIGVGMGPGLPNYSLGQATGSPTATLIQNNLPPHVHQQMGSGGVPTQNTAAGAVLASNDRSVNPPMPNIYGTNNIPVGMGSVTGATGGGQPFSITQPVLALNYIIATEGVFPSRD